MPILRKNNNVLENFGPNEDKKSTLKKQNIEGDHINLVGKNSDTKSHTKDSLSGRTP